MKKRLLKLSVLLFAVSIVFANAAPKFDEENVFHVCPIGQNFELEVSATDNFGVVTLSCNLGSFPGATFVDHGNGKGEFDWTPALGDEGFAPELKVTVSDGTLSTTKSFVLWVSSAGVPVVDIKGTSWSGHGNDFETSDMAWTLYGVSADSINHLIETTWINRASGINGQAAGAVPFWQLSAYELGLVEGDNLIVAAAYNDVGDVSYNGINIVYDISPPLVTITNPVSTIVITNVSELIVGGTTEEEQTEITGVSWSTLPSLTSGTMLNHYSWSVDGASIGLTEGTNIVKVSATNSVGLTGSDSVTIILDLTPPEIVITNPANGNNFLIGREDFVLSGYANDPDTELASVMWENKTASAKGTAVGIVDWEVSGTNLELVQGSNLIVVTVANVFGITAEDTIYIIYDDYVPPVITIDFPSNGIYFTETKLFSVIGTAYDLESNLKPITWTCESGGLFGAASGIASWSENANNIGLVPGSNVFTATAENIFGLTAEANCTIIFEENPPYVEIQSPNNGNDFLTGITNFMLEGIAGDIDTEMVEVTWSNELTGAHGDVNGIANWTVSSSSLGMIFGENRIVVRAKNIFGYIGNDSILIDWDDTTAPIVEIQSPNDGNYFVTNVTDILFGGIANDIESGIANLTWEILPGGSKGNTTGIENWEISAGAATILNGTNVLTVTGTNGIGLATTDELIFVHDATPPEIVITNPVDAEVYTIGNDNFFLGGYAIDPDSDILKVSWENQTTRTNGTANGIEDWKVAGTELELVQGSNLIVVTVENVFGITAEDTIYIIYDDATPPVISIDFPSNGIYFTETKSFSVIGTAYDLESNLKPITWTCESGGLFGTASGIASWSENANNIGLVPGSNVFTATAENIFGLSASANCTIIYEENPPFVEIQAPNNGNNFSTGITNFMLEGIAGDVDTEIVEVTWSNELTGAHGDVNGIANWTIDSSSLGMTFGENRIVIRAKNIFGYIGSDSVLIDWDDTTAPIVEIKSPNNGNYFVTNVTDILFGGIANDIESGIANLTWKILPGGSKGNTIGIENWEIAAGTANILNGTNVLTVTGTNGVGLATSDELIFVYDPTAPEIVITNPVDAEVYSIGTDNFLLGGYVIDPDSVIVKVSWENVTAGTNGLAIGTENWNIAAENFNLKQGSNEIVVTVLIDNGNTASDSIIIIFDDVTPPIIDINSPSENPLITINNYFSILGTSEDTESEITSISWSCLPGGLIGQASGFDNWNVNANQIGLQPGTNYFEITAENKFGLTATDSMYIIYEANLPYVIITSPNNGNDYYTGTTNFIVEGIANDADTLLSKVVWSNAITHATGLADGIESWSVDAGLLGISEGRNEIIVNAENIYGLNGTEDRIIIYVEDNTVPYIYIDTPNSGETYLTLEKEFEVSGFAQDNESGISRIEWEVKPSGENGVADGIAEWSIAEGEFKLSEGSNILTVTAYNGLGGVGEDSQIIIVDSTVPVVEILSPTTQTFYNISGINFNVGGTVIAGSSTLEKFGWSNTTTVTKGNLSNNSGTWTVVAKDLNLVRGTNLIEIFAVNGLGCRGSDVISLIISDQEIPKIEITSPGNGDFITESPVQIAGTASDDVGIYRIDVNGVNAIGNENWYASITLQPGINLITATAFDLPPSQSAQDKIMLLYGDKDKEIIDVEITGPSKDYYWETTGTNVSLAGSASGVFGVQKLIWINKSLPNQYGYTDGQSIWTAAEIPLAEGSNEIMVVAYDMNDNWGKDTIMVYSSDASATNISPVIFEKVKINRNKKVSYSVFLRDMLVVRGKISETAFNNFDVSDKKNPDTLSVLMKGKTTTGKVLIRNWNSNERIEQASWNKVLWNETNKKNVKIKKSVGGIQIGPVKEGKMKAKFKWKKARNGKPAETTFLIKIDRQKLLGNQTDNIDSIDLSEPVEFWLGIGNTQVRGTVIFDEKTFKAKQINQ